MVGMVRVIMAVLTGLTGRLGRHRSGRPPVGRGLHRRHPGGSATSAQGKHDELTHEAEDALTKEAKNPPPETGPAGSTSTSDPHTQDVRA